MIKCTDHHITSNFADYQSFRTVPHAGTDYGHQGMVYFPFVAPDDGTILSTNGKDSFILDCPKVYEMEDGNKAHFQHQFVHINTPNLPKVGAFYKQGQVITKSGDSNGTAQPHLHWTCIVRWLRNGGGNNALCDGGRFVDTGEVWVSKNENGLQSWYQSSSWTGIPKGNPIALKLLFKSADKMIEELRRQINALQTELNTVKGLLNEKDGQISSLNGSITDLNTKLAVCTQEKQDLLLRADKLDADFSDFKAASAATQENLEEDLSKKESAIEVLTKNNERLQEELRACQASGGGGVNPDPTVTILARFVKWLRELLAKIPSKRN